MDLKMPVLNGLEATKQIKALRPGLPVIAQTAFASPIDEQRSMEAGCDDFMAKPIDKILLIEKINKYY
jgi:two-component system cell cycle response regulator DivK